MIVLDANYILRFLLNDNNEMFSQAKATISQQQCLVLNEIIAEVVYVLYGVYKVPKSTIAQSLSKLISLDNLSMHEQKNTLIKALTYYQSKNIDFIDCYLCALKEKYQVKSFDKRLNKCLNSQTL